MGEVSYWFQATQRPVSTAWAELDTGVAVR